MTAVSSRVLRLLPSVFVLVLLSVLPSFAGEPAACSGVDMLEEYKAKDPELYRGVARIADSLENGDAILWRVEKPGLPASHLFGTIHLSDPRIAKFSKSTKAAFDAAKTVALEYTGGPEAAGAALGKHPERLMYTDGSTLQSALTEAEFKSVQRIASKSDFPEPLARVLRPWFVNLLLAISDCERRRVASGAQSLDTMIEATAAAAGKELKGLETPEQQFEALLSIPDDQQVQMLKAALRFVDREDDQIETLLQMYTKRRIGAALPFQMALAAEGGTPETAYDGFVKILLVDRNLSMRDAAIPLLETGGAFIAVGAMHLPGDTGLVRLLRDKGYAVTAVE